MKKRLNKKAYFFLIDSILALGVLALGGFIILTQYTQIPSKLEANIISEDLMDFFAKNKIKDVDNLYVGLGGELWETEDLPGGLCPGEDLIANGENTLLEQIAVFYENSQPPTNKPCYFNLDDIIPDVPEDLIEKLILNLIQNIIPPQYGFEIWMNDQLLYPATEAEQIASKSSAEVLIPSKRIIYGIKDEQTGELFGPYEVEVIVWRLN